MKSNPSRKSLSQPPLSEFSPPSSTAPTADQPFDPEAPKHLVPDSSPAFSNGPYEKPDEPPIARKSTSRRRRSTISIAVPDSERPRETGWSAPQVPVRRNVEHKSQESPVLPFSVQTKSQEPGCSSPNPPASIPKNRLERRPEDFIAGRVPSPSPRINFREATFASSIPGQQTNRANPPEQSGQRAKSRAQHQESNTGGEWGIRGPIGSSVVRDGPRLKQPSVLVKKSGRDTRSDAQGVSSPRIAASPALESEIWDDNSLLSHPDSIAAPHETWNRNIPSPSEGNRLLSSKSQATSYHRIPDPDHTPPAPTTVHRLDGPADEAPPYRHRQRSTYIRSPLKEPESVPSSSTVTHYATASDFSSEPSGTRGVLVEDQSFKRNTHMPNQNVALAGIISKDRHPPNTVRRIPPTEDYPSTMHAHQPRSVLSLTRPQMVDT